MARGRHSRRSRIIAQLRRDNDQLQGDLAAAVRDTMTAMAELDRVTAALERALSDRDEARRERDAARVQAIHLLLALATCGTAVRA